MQISPDDVIYELDIPRALLKKDKIVSYTTYKNEESESSLLNAILEIWGPYLIQYRKKEVNSSKNNIRRIIYPDPVYVVLGAIIDLLTPDDSSHMDKALVKMYEDGKGIIRAFGKEYEENRKKWYHKPDFDTKSGAVGLYELGLADYVVPTIDGLPDNENVGWVCSSFREFPEFHETFSKLLKSRIQENKENSKFEKAYKILEELSEERGI